MVRGSRGYKLYDKNAMHVAIARDFSVACCSAVDSAIERAYLRFSTRFLITELSC